MVGDDKGFSAPLDMEYNNNNRDHREIAIAVALNTKITCLYIHPHHVNRLIIITYSKYHLLV